MAIELIKISEFPQVSEPGDWIVVSDAAGTGYKISKEDFKEWLGTVTVITDKPIALADPAPTMDGAYLPTEPGTYTNAGGLVYDPAGVDAGKYVQFIKNDTVWTKLAVDLPQAENKIEEWESGVANTTGVIKEAENNFIYRVKDSVPSTLQNPVTGTDWDVLGNYSVVNVDDMVTPSGDYLSAAEARSALPIPLRNPYMKIRYRQVYGYKEEYLANLGYNIDSAYWREDTNARWVDLQNKILSHNNGISLYGDNVFISKMINFTTDLTIENFFVQSGSDLVCGVFDANYNYLGDYTDSLVTGGKNSTNLVFLDVKAVFPTVAYLRFNGRVNDGFKAYTSTGSFPPTLGAETRRRDRENSTENIFNEPGYISKANGLTVDSSDYKHTIALRLIDRNNLLVSGFSGVSNSVALVSFYDIALNWLGSYNTATHGDVNIHKVTPSSIPDSTFFVVVTRRTNHAASILEGVEKEPIPKTLQNFSEGLVNEGYSVIFNEPGFINKTNGILTESVDYRSTIFLKLIDPNNLFISGYSGVTNNAALVSFYGVSRNYLGSWNAATNGIVNNIKVPVGDIPAGTYFVRATRRNPQAGASISGVEKRVSNKTIQELVINSTPAGMSNRSSVPNVNVGGDIKLTNYLGNRQNIHPKVLYFASGWNGYKFWMAYTPYPNGATAHENPCLAVSNDGENWIDPPGVSNPLDPAPAFGYNSDTHLVYRADLDRLEIWWRPYNISLASDMTKRRTSTDGVNWTVAETIFDTDDDQHISPSIIFEDGKYKMWSVRSGNIHYQETVTADPLGTWTEKETLPIAFSSSVYAWHADVIHSDKGYEFVVQCNDVPGNGNSSDLYYVLQDGVTFTEPVKIIARGDTVTDIDYGTIYRSSIVVIDGVYWIYYSCTDVVSNRSMCLTRGRDIRELRGVNL